eukprot:4411862-Karenia_brevis.AAC.1
MGLNGIPPLLDCVDPFLVTSAHEPTESPDDSLDLISSRKSVDPGGCTTGVLASSLNSSKLLSIF